MFQIQKATLLDVVLTDTPRHIGGMGMSLLPARNTVEIIEIQMKREIDKLFET